MKNKYSVPVDYIGKPVRLKVSNESLQIYYSTELIVTHPLSDKRLNYKKEHYTQLLSRYMKSDDEITARYICRNGHVPASILPVSFCWDTPVF